MTANYDVRHKHTCSKCGNPSSFIHIDGLAFAVKATRAALHGDRIMRGSWVSVCPICDAYLLMREFTWGVPFYSERDMAVISIADYDCMDAISLLEFGNLPFTLGALTGALHVVDRSSALDDENHIAPLDSDLLGPTGIPDDESANAEWLRQLEILNSNLPERSNIAAIDAAVRHLVRQVPGEPTSVAKMVSLNE